MSKNKTIILEISGDDYAAMSAVEDYGIDNLYEMAKEAGGRIELEGFRTVLIHEFGYVDPSFIAFARDFLDYDATKTRNFHVINQ